MDAKTVAILVGCIVTVVGALSYISRTQAKAAERSAASQQSLVRELAVTHIRNVEVRLGELVTSSAETLSVLRENTAAIHLLVSRFDPPPPGGVMTATSEDDTPPLGIVKPVEPRKPTGVYQFPFKKRGLKDK